MGFNVSQDAKWMESYEAIWSKIDSLLMSFEKLSGSAMKKEKYINPKLLMWEDKVKTHFKGKELPTEYCEATGVLKIGSVYTQGLNHYLQVFLKECKYSSIDSIFESQLSEDDETGHDTVF